MQLQNRFKIKFVKTICADVYDYDICIGMWWWNIYGSDSSNTISYYTYIFDLFMKHEYTMGVNSN